MRLKRDCFAEFILSAAEGLLCKQPVRPSRASGRTGSLPLVVSPSNHEPRGTSFHLSVALRRSVKIRNDTGENRKTPRVLPGVLAG